VQADIVRDFVKWDDEPHDLVSIEESFARAVAEATSAPHGPVYLCYDVDLQEDPVPAGLTRRASHGSPHPPTPPLPRRTSGGLTGGYAKPSAR
jgi:thiamine pyrophosphate-dependent acetolactate synthase large subunit-like protein